MDRKCVPSVMWIILLYSFITAVHCDCGLPLDIPYGSPKAEFADKMAFAVGLTVKYDCRPGFIRVPGAKNYITCLDNSEWSSNDEFCRLRACGYPGDMENGYFEAENFLFASRVKYYCDAGYYMTSKRCYRECQADGTWSNSVPECEAAMCPPPETIPNGTFYPVKEEYYFADAVRYECSNPNMVMEYDSSIFCMENGNWSDPQPRCIEVNCESPVVPHSRKLSGFIGPYRLHSMVRFECNRGFQMEGSDTIVCNLDSRWEPAPPECIGAFCPEPRLLHGKVIRGKKTDGYKVRDSITLACDTNSNLNGANKVTCGNDFQWNPNLPTCELENGCSSPNIRNGRVTLKNGISYDPEIHGHGFSSSDKIEITCDTGYRLRGRSESECVYQQISRIPLGIDPPEPLLQVYDNPPEPLLQVYDNPVFREILPV
ncbi:PREDICTED: complement receptor type 1-like [Nanorana parkeri]|uniref:complement receptor type 1-like n=1 Tax=Nanorana parkeri TaxID=125878 RepID=UPI0008540AED|nr:PREDICTED: complement receptor type 1-like [Nanorana parkeri]